MRFVVIHYSAKVAAMRRVSIRTSLPATASASHTEFVVVSRAPPP